MKSDKRILAACCVAVVIYLGLTMLMLGQTGCGGGQLPGVVTPAKIQTCTVIANNCVQALTYAHGDADKITETSEICLRDWNGADCNKLVEALVSMGKDL